VFPLHKLAACTINATEGRDFSTCPDPECVADIWSESSNDLSGDTDFVDLGVLSFHFNGSDIALDDIQWECPEAFSGFVNCIVVGCPEFLDVCSDQDLPGETLLEEGLLLLENTTDLNMTISPTDCSGLTDGFCSNFEFSDACCLSTCRAEMYELVSCVARPLLEEAEPACNLPVCFESTPTVSYDANPILVNSSFLLTSLKGENAAQLREALKAGQLEDLQAAYKDFVETFASDFFGLQLSEVVQSGAFEDEIRRQLEKLMVELDPESIQVYDFVDSPCLNTTLAESTEVSKQRENNSTGTCITAFGRYRVLADPKEDVNTVYASTVEATQASIADGQLQESLQRVNEDSTFVVDGVSDVVDDSFDPFDEIESTLPPGETQTTVAPTPRSTEEPEDSAACLHQFSSLALVATTLLAWVVVL